MTWAFVITCPSESITNPEPLPSGVMICTTLGEMSFTMDDSVGVLTGTGVWGGAGVGATGTVGGTGGAATAMGVSVGVAWGVRWLLVMNDPGGIGSTAVAVGAGAGDSVFAATAVAVISATTVARMSDVGEAVVANSELATGALGGIDRRASDRTHAIAMMARETPIASDKPNRNRLTEAPIFHD